ncbi:MAG: hypothetical protein KGJ29_15315 [Hyphomicrobiales bacterium]|nr:hypothetical protein [Hyphomicrobiales bacterium]
MGPSVLVRECWYNTQLDSFERAARALGCDESEEHFNEVLGKIARAKPAPDDKPEKIEKPQKTKPAK